MSREARQLRADGAIGCFARRRRRIRWPIACELEETTGRDVLLGSVYTALDRLEGRGFASSRLGDPTPERGGRAKRYFKVTAKGLREARETQVALMKLWSGLRALQGGTA